MKYSKIEEIIGYRFKNVEFLEQAYTRRSYSNENQNAKNNEILEFVGDAVIKLYVTKYIVEKTDCVGKCEGELSKQRTEYENGAFLAERVDKLGLLESGLLRLGKGDREQKEYQETKVKADLLESIIGAVALDCEYSEKVLAGIVGKLVCNP